MPVQILAPATTYSGIAHDWHIGDLWLIAANITDSSGTPVDPTAVAATVTAPSGSTSTPLVVKTSVGGYETNVNLTESGAWHVLISGTGNYQAAQPASIRVLED